MDSPSLEIRQLYDKALAFDNAGDIYNAVKLYKKIAKACPQWSAPFERLYLLYKYRQDWKAALYYTKKTVALDPSNSNAWWDLGIASSALKRWRIARSVWTKFGVKKKENPLPPRSAVQLKAGKRFEIVEIKLLDPARGIINSIPFPNTDRRYKDIIIFDRVICGTFQSAKKGKLPIYRELGVQKRSVYQTTSCWLHEAEKEEVLKLEGLCRQYQLGFEIWSNAQLNSSKVSASKIPEYYHIKGLNTPSENGVWVAIAAKSIAQVRAVLDSWEIICLKSYSDLVVHN